MADPNEDMIRAIRLFHNNPLARNFVAVLADRLGMCSVSSLMLKQALAHGPLLDLFEKVERMDNVRTQEASMWNAKIVHQTIDP